MNNKRKIYGCLLIAMSMVLFACHSGWTGRKDPAISNGLLYAKRIFVESSGYNTVEPLMRWDGLPGVYVDSALSNEFVQLLTDRMSMLLSSCYASRLPQDSCFLAEATVVCVLFKGSTKGSDTLVIGWPAGMRLNEHYYAIDSQVVDIISTRLSQPFRDDLHRLLKEK